MKSIFNTEACQEILDRFENISQGHQAIWGEMNVSQMLKHCQKPIKLAFGEEEVTKPNLLMRLMIKFIKPTLYNEKPWKQGLPTAKEFVVRDNIDFEIEKVELKKLIKRMRESESYFTPSKKHPIFGNMKSWMWGQSVYKHLDHHLQQFGA